MLTLTRNRTARLTIIAMSIALLAAIAAPIVAFAQSAVTTPRPRITEVTLAGEANNARKNFIVGETITALVKFDNRWEVRAVDTPEASDDDPAWQRLELYIGGITRDAQYAGALPGNPNIRQFSYTIQEGDAVKFRSVEAREMKTHNLHYVYVGNDADGCEGGELTETGFLLSTLLVGSFLHLLPPEEIYTPYTCDEYASWLIIPRPQDPLRYEGGSGG